MNGIDLAFFLKVLGDIVLVSIPEEFFIVMLALLLLGKFDFLQSDDKEERKIKKYDVTRVAFLVISTAVISNILRCLNADPNLLLLICVLYIFIFILVIYKMYWDWGEILKTFLFTLLSVIVFALIEFSYAPLFFYIFNMTVDDLNNSVLIKFVWAIPERLVEYLLLGFLIARKATFLKARIVKVILRDRLLTVITLLALFFNLAFLSVIEKLIWFDKILDGFSLAVQLGISVAVLVFPILNIAALVFAIYHISNRECENRFLAKQDIKITADDIKMFAKNGRYDKIMHMVDILEEDANKLYRDA